MLKLLAILPPFFIVFFKVGKCITQNGLDICFQSVPNYKLVLRMVYNTWLLSCYDLRYDNSNTVCLVLYYHILSLAKIQNIHLSIFAVKLPLTTIMRLYYSSIIKYNLEVEKCQEVENILH